MLRMTGQTADRVRHLVTGWAADAGEFVHDLAWSPDGNHLAVAAADGSVSVFGAGDGKLRWRADGHPLATTSVDWSPDGALVASGGQDSTVRLWNAADGRAQAALACGSQWLEGLAWLSNGQLLTACGRALRLWSADGTSLQAFATADSTVTGLDLLADDTFFSCCYGKVQHWRADDPDAAREFPWKDSVLSVAASPDGRWVAAGCQDRSVHIWDRASGEDLAMSGYGTKVRLLSWDHSGRYLATDGAHEALIVWDCAGSGPSGREPLYLPAHMEKVSDLRFTHGDRRFASGGEDGLVYIVGMDDRRPLFGLWDEAPVSKIAWSRNDSHLAVGYASGRISVSPVPVNA